MAKMWWQQNERGGKFLLKLTLLLVTFVPNFVLRPIVFCVSFIYYIFCKNERDNIKFYLSLLKQRGVSVRSAFWNFYEFAMSICDKFKAWLGKIKLNDINIVDINAIKKEFVSQSRGRILVVSHFGNIDIARTLSSELEWLDITILMYTKHSSEFFKILNEVSKTPVKVLEVDELDVSAMIKIKEIIDKGGHIGIMGDRVNISGTKSVSVPFLGKECEFPVGAFILAGLLKTKVSTFFTFKSDDVYHISFSHIADEVSLGRDKEASVKPYLLSYVRSLEQMCERYPHYFFNFYDFWQVKR
ncbi:hypothetical protein [Campylobacter suis]|uniref:Lipid A biosynthesis acyltransferase n=1 Tax=Campylobacter suis TaxID=2790657 RepID=A0ABN7K0V2_9BACT|nr:hypothetical protein [Campylobacter suis]CAD7286188.1 hypothetical protein LMG8286_00019 [Campylobacter suis]